MAIKAIINNTEKEIEQIKNSDEQDIDYVYSRIGDTEVEGEPPISIKSIGGNLADYRIYGNTVGGAGVGDLVESGEHAGEYEVPVTVEGKNLLPNTAISQTINGVTFTVNGDGSVTCNGTCVNNIAVLHIRRPATFDDETIQYTLTGCPAGGEYNSTYALEYSNGVNQSKPDVGNGVSFTPYREKSYPYAMVRVIIFLGYTCNNLTFYPMIRKADIEDDTYEPYHAPVTTPIYLPEQIRKVGDEAEYIDYSEQKLHRVRKNLLQNQAVDREIEGVTFTVNSDGSITCNGTASDNTNSGSISSSSLPAGSYYLNGTPSGGSLSTYYMYVACYTESEIILYNDVGDGVSFTIDNSCNINVRIAIKSGCTCNNLTFYPMIRKADITDDTYEPYIVNTEVNTNLPALSTIKGTNILSVNTSIQPSNIYIKDSFDYKKVFTATRTIEDELPLNYRNIEDNDSTLDNYRIYGNTVGGESVGDLVESGEHAGEYSVPVTVTNGTNTETTNIYLPEQIKMVGDDAEYVDFVEQKQYFADGTSISVNLPTIFASIGMNTIRIETNVVPSGVRIKGRFKKITTTTYVQSIEPDKTNNKIIFVVRAYLSENDRMVRTGLVATNDPAIGVNINVNSTVITSGCKVFVKELAGVEPTTKKTEYVWTKTKVTDGEIWYVRSYVEYINSDNEQLIIHSDAAKASLDGIIT